MAITADVQNKAKNEEIQTTTKSLYKHVNTTQKTDPCKGKICDGYGRRRTKQIQKKQKSKH